MGIQIDSPIRGVPYPDTGVQTARRNLSPVKGNSVDLTEMASKSTQALAFRYAPYLGCCVIGAGHYDVTVDFETPDTSLVADEDVLAETLLKVPNAERSISRARYCRVRIGHF